MDDQVRLAERFEEHRRHLTSVACRMLGSATEADDALQETWLRFSRSDTDDVENLGAWLTTVVSRVCLTMLEARRSRGAAPPPDDFDVVAADIPHADPEDEAVLADSVGLALMVVLDTLTPAERVSFVLHDVFGVPFEDIGAVVGRSPAAARQLASRGRRRVRGPAASVGGDRLRQATVVEAFLAATRQGDFERLLTILDPDVVLRADDAAVALGAPREVHGATAAAGFLRRARAARPALADGVPVAVWMPRGELRVLIRLTVVADRIVAADVVAEPRILGPIDLVVTD
jgi:RNA polymerase sigma-70 factor (ECF subfamily)